MIGKLYIDLKNKSKMELEAGLDEIRQRQKQEDLKGEHVLIIFIILKIDIQLLVCTELGEQVKKQKELLDKASAEMIELKKRHDEAMNNYKRKYQE